MVLSMKYTGIFIHHKKIELTHFEVKEQVRLSKSIYLLERASIR